MNINALVDTLSAAIATDPDLTAWCQANYGRGPTVFVSFDERNPPAAGDLPAVILYPVSKAVGLLRAGKDHGVMVECWLENDGLHSRDGIGNIVEYTGTRHIEQMRKLVETVASGIDTGDTILAEAAIEYDTISHFPAFFAVMLLTYQEESVPLGADRME